MGVELTLLCDVYCLTDKGFGRMWVLKRGKLERGGDVDSSCYGNGRMLLFCLLDGWVVRRAIEGEVEDEDGDRSVDHQSRWQK